MFEGMPQPTCETIPQPTETYPVPLFRLAEVTVFGLFASVGSCREFLARHQAMFPRRYIRDGLGRRVRVLTGQEVRRLQELRLQYGK